MLLSSSSIERYDYFSETYLGITQCEPQKMIASFIGIDPQALSTLRKDRATGKKITPLLRISSST